MKTRTKAIAPLAERFPAWEWFGSDGVIQGRRTGNGWVCVERGVLALSVLTEKYGTAAGLCRYAIGNAAPKSCRYSRRVLGLLESME